MKVGRKPVNAAAMQAWKKYRPKAIKPLAEHLGMSQPGVSRWKQVPKARLDAVAAWIGATPDELRPDLNPWSALN